ncbi:hypervirulence associated TUDOR domain-containing protein [Allorhodopirellula solitaria]|uniref:Hypervirulence associated protein TUDOR domain-containing protein n=1 Tax=Allorhodopirellula solitaria TaxID=2527987 RepID=A0A5C5YD41_9BACT|nr:DUF2945 domain-containing protein [Allorhodopirellula solitaria]TWT73290.1 hypothetical protein CA85_17580 [Allorhodopirellula solitaria]
MTQQFRIRQHVSWNYAGNTARGQIKEAFTDKVRRTIEGTEVTRNATKEQPAYLIEQENGGEVLKSESELSEP